MDLILAFASLQDLKSLRSSCKHFSTFTDSVLFHTIIIVPCPASFNLITTLPQRDRISRHVRKLVYDDRWPDLFRSVRTAFVKSNGRLAMPDVQSKLLRRLDQLNQLTQSFKADSSSEVAHFKQVLDTLFALRSVSVFSSHKHDNSARLPHFYTRICGDLLRWTNVTNLLPGQPQHSARGRSALLAIAQCRGNITDIHLNGFKWRQLSYSGTETSVFTHSIFASVRRVELSSNYLPGELFFHGKTLLARLGDALSEAIHLEVLRLDIEDETTQDDTYDVEGFDGRSWCMLSALFHSEHQYRNLRELDLRNMRFSETGLTNFLDHHASTLTSLRLNSVELVATRSSRSPCWRRVFIHIQATLCLCEALLQDGLYISGGGVWISMHPMPEGRFPGCLLDKVEHFILEGGECPIRDDYHELNVNDLNGLGDESWAFY